MAWVRIDDGFAQHPKVASAGPLAMAMHVAALCYCNRNLTDGFVPRAVARTLVDWEVVDSEGRIHTIACTSGMAGNDVTSEWVIGLLVDSGMWIEEPKGYRIHDYLDYQPSAAEIERQREKTKDRVNKWRKKKVAKSNGNRNADSNDKRNAVTNDVSNGPVTGAPVPDPVPSNLEPNGSKNNVHDGEFDEWWESYPRKQGKGQALKAYRAARKKTDAQTLIDGVARYREIKPDYADWAMPATWLNGERWLDEPVEDQGDTEAKRLAEKWEKKAAEEREGIGPKATETKAPQASKPQKEITPETGPLEIPQFLRRA